MFSILTHPWYIMETFWIYNCGDPGNTEAPKSANSDDSTSAPAPLESLHEQKNSEKVIFWGVRADNSSLIVGTHTNALAVLRTVTARLNLRRWGSVVHCMAKYNDCHLGEGVDTGACCPEAIALAAFLPMLITREKSQAHKRCSRCRNALTWNGSTPGTLFPPWLFQVKTGAPSHFRVSPRFWESSHSCCRQRRQSELVVGVDRSACGPRRTAAWEASNLTSNLCRVRWPWLQAFDRAFNLSAKIHQLR